MFGGVPRIRCGHMALSFGKTAKRFNSLAATKRLNTIQLQRPILEQKSIQLKQTRHFDDCLKKEEDSGKKTCTPPSLAKDPCGTQKKKEKEKKKDDEPKEKPVIEDGKRKIKSMWDLPDCKRVVDCDLPIRYDVLHYRISDKANRDYQVTWVECPKILIKPKKVCVYDHIEKPERKRRIRSATAAAKGATACKTQDPMSCPKKTGEGPCPRVAMPCCPPARIPPSCAKTRVKSDCTKKKTPYPSFSECLKDPPIPLPPTECKCLEVQSMCEAWAELRRRMAAGKPAVPKCP